MSSLTRDNESMVMADTSLCVPTETINDNWWVMPAMPEVVDSFTGVELHPLSDALVIMPFEKYELWWFMEFDGAFEYQATHGPYTDEETAIEAGMKLVDSAS